MSNERAVSGQVEVTQDSKAAVAFKLMEFIGREEYSKVTDQQKDRTYWLTLYRQCHKAVYGSRLDTILTKE